MAGIGAMPAVAASKVAAVIPCASAVTRASARNAVNLASAGLDGAEGGGAIGMRTAGADGGVGLGAVAVQATTASRPARPPSHRNPRQGSARKAVRMEGTHTMVHWYT